MVRVHDRPLIAPSFHLVEFGQKPGVLQRGALGDDTVGELDQFTIVLGGGEVLEAVRCVVFVHSCAPVAIVSRGTVFEQMQ